MTRENHDAVGPERLTWRTDVPVRYEADVAVIGGGIAGVAAACAAARERRRTGKMAGQGATRRDAASTLGGTAGRRVAEAGAIRYNAQTDRRSSLNGWPLRRPCRRWVMTRRLLLTHLFLALAGLITAASGAPVPSDKIPAFVIPRMSREPMTTA